MNIRNPKYNTDNTIDREMEHPVYGWIPFTASPDDVEHHGRQIYAQAVAQGGIEPYEPPAVDPEAERLQRIAEIDRRLAEIDQESVRPLRAIVDAALVGDADTEHDRAKLAELEQEAEQLRAERGTLANEASS